MEECEMLQRALKFAKEKHSNKLESSTYNRTVHFAPYVRVKGQVLRVRFYLLNTCVSPCKFI